jgi:uncharacterized protein (DUF1697 family)
LGDNRAIAAYVALLRAVNLGPHGKVSMPQLKDLVAGLGFGDVATLLNSGNVVFTGKSSGAAALEARLESAAAEQLGLKTEFMVRTANDLAGVIADNPFPKEAKEDPGHLVVVFLKERVTKGKVEDLQEAVAGREVVKGEGNELYISYPDGIGTSKLTSAVIERKIGTRGTGRNWNTVLKLDGLLRQLLAPRTAGRGRRPASSARRWPRLRRRRGGPAVPRPGSRGGHPGSGG